MKWVDMWKGGKEHRCYVTSWISPSNVHGFSCNARKCI